MATSRLCSLLLGVALLLALVLPQNLVSADACFDALPQKMLAALEGLTPRDAEEAIHSELRLWGIDPSKTNPPLQLHVPEFADYIAQAHSCWKQNNIIADRFCEWEALILPTLEPNSKTANDMQDIFRKAFIHSIFLHLLNEQIKENYPRAKILFEAIQKEIDTKLKPKSRFGFKIFKHATMFESGKLNLILPALAKTMDLIINKQPLPKDEYRCGHRINGVSINIGEAGYFDLDNGYYDNAEAAIPMMLSPNVEKDEPHLEARETHYDETLKVILTYQPFPTEWAKLYESWNLAFTMGNYENYPMYWAKLLNPSTSCYHHTPGSYLHNRGVTLLLHILHEVFWRYRVSPTHDYHLFNRAATSFHGSLNKIAAEEYKLKVDRAAPKLIKQKHVTELKTMIDAYRKGDVKLGNDLRFKYGFKKVRKMICAPWTKDHPEDAEDPYAPAPAAKEVAGSGATPAAKEAVGSGAATPTRGASPTRGTSPTRGGSPTRGASPTRPVAGGASGAAGALQAAHH